MKSITQFDHNSNGNGLVWCISFARDLVDLVDTRVDTPRAASLGLTDRFHSRWICTESMGIDFRFRDINETTTGVGELVNPRGR